MSQQMDELLKTLRQKHICDQGECLYDDEMRQAADAIERLLRENKTLRNFLGGIQSTVEA